MSLFGDDDIIYDDDERDGDFESASPVSAESEKLQEPKAMQFCLGHEEQEQLFIDLFQNNSLPHAMIFSGNEGIGKTTMAFRLARFLLKNGKVDDNQDSLFGGEDIKADVSSLDVDADDPVFARVVSGGHADLLHICREYDSAKGKQDASLKVDALRKIEPFLRKTASEGGWRIVVVEDADTMNRSAQNAILKILEEPPPNVLIMLIAHRPGMLIPTIRSRARVIPFEPLSQENMKDLLARQGHYLSVEDMTTLASLSEGSIGQALRYIEQGGLETLAQLLGYLETAPNWNWARLHELSASLSSPAQDKEYRMFVDLLQWVFAQILRVQARGSSDIPPALSKVAASQFMMQIPLERLITISDNLKNHFERVEFSNLDRRDAIRSCFLVISD